MVFPVRPDAVAASGPPRVAFAAPAPLPAAAGLWQSDPTPPASPRAGGAPARDEDAGDGADGDGGREPGAEPTGWFARRLVRGDDATLWAVRLGLCAVVVGWLAVIVSLFV
jgi:hypothetical protein